MNSLLELDRVFPLANVSAERPVLRAPRLECAVKPIAVSAVLGNRAFMRAWAARRARSVSAPSRAS